MNFLMKYRMKRVAKGIGGLLLLALGAMLIIIAIKAGMPKQNDWGEIAKWGVIVKGMPIPLILLFPLIGLALPLGFGILLLISAFTGDDITWLLRKRSR